MRRIALAMALMAGLTAPLALPAQSTPAPEPASAPATSSASSAASAPYKVHFEDGEPIDDYFTSMAQRFGIAMVQKERIKAFILKGFDLPEKYDQALAAGRQALEPQGFTLLQSVSNNQIVVRVVTVKEARRIELEESPVTSGAAPEKIDVSKPDRLVTHLLPVAHGELLDGLRRLAAQQPDVQVSVSGTANSGYTLILTGPARQVQTVVEAMVKVDQSAEAKIVVRTLQLKNLRAIDLAGQLNEQFATDRKPVKAVADARTNSIIVTGPEDKVLDAMVVIVGLEASKGRIVPLAEHPPATAPSQP